MRPQFHFILHLAYDFLFMTHVVKRFNPILIMAKGGLEDGKSTPGRKKKSKDPKVMRMKYARKFNPNNRVEVRSSPRLPSVESPGDWQSIPCPSRQGHELSQDQIDNAIRAIYVLKGKGQLDVMSKVSELLDIHSNTLYTLWAEFKQTGMVPKSSRSRKRAVRMKLVGMEWCEPIRVEVERIRLVHRRAVEIPDIQRWLLDQHGISIGRDRLRYRMLKMGFIFSKTKKLTMKKEDARIRRLRQDYLKRRHEYDKVIEETSDRRKLLTEQGLLIPPDLREIVYIYLDESYVNRL